LLRIDLLRLGQHLNVAEEPLSLSDASFNLIFRLHFFFFEKDVLRQNHSAQWCLFNQLCIWVVALNEPNIGRVCFQGQWQIHRDGVLFEKWMCESFIWCGSFFWLSLKAPLN